MKPYKSDKYQKSSSEPKKYQKSFIFTKIEVLDSLDFKCEKNPLTIANELKILKKELDPVKDMLANYTSDTYRAIRNNVDLYKDLIRIITNDYNGQHVTNAWLKYWEIYSYFRKYLPTKKINAFLNAELPGASICALNHFCRVFNIELDWFASSYSPYTKSGEEQGVLEDRYGIWKHNKQNWLMNEKNDGDATKIENLLDYEERVKKSKFGGCDIYSHDAGIDVSSNYNEQEIQNQKIHLGCAIAGFLTLKKGGIFIAKQYTFFDPLTYNLIVIYSSMFENFYICKPQTSRPYNSEIYLIGVGFLTFPQNIRDILFNKLKNFNRDPIICDDKISSHNAENILHFAQVVYKQQISHIKEQCGLYESKNMDRFTDIKKTLIDTWLTKYPIRRLEREEHLPSD